MVDCMVFPNDWAVFLEDYSFRDAEEVYTNGARLIPAFRVEQMMHHYLRKAAEEGGRRWIPVTERLPECGQKVLVFAHYPFDEVGRMEAVPYNPEMYEPFWGCVTHWMPLPEPPKGVE